MQTTTIQQNKRESLLMTSVLIWGLASFVLGYFNAFSFLPMPMFGVTVILIMAVLISLYYGNSGFRTYADSIPLSSIAIFHSWRIFAGWIFLANSGVLSQTFINNAAYGDIIAGFLGISVLIFGRTKRNYLIFNILGSVDFILAVGTGLTLTLLGDPHMSRIIQLPIILIPLFGVPLSGFTHLLSLDRLFRAKHLKMNEVIH